MESHVKVSAPRNSAGAFATASNTSVNVAACHVMAIHAVCAAGAGVIVLTDGNGGATVANIALPASATQILKIEFPSAGLRFESGPYLATATNVTSANLIYKG